MSQTKIFVEAGAAATILSIYHDLASAALALAGDRRGARRRGDKIVSFAQGYTAPSRSSIIGIASVLLALWAENR